MYIIVNIYIYQTHDIELSIYIVGHQLNFIYLSDHIIFPVNKHYFIVPTNQLFVSD